MYARIVVPVDGSDDALAALGPARRLARLHQAQLSLVTVATPDTTAEEEEIETIVAAGQRAAGDPAPEVIVLRSMDAASELARLSRDHPEALLCLRTRARPHVAGLLGSVAGELLRISEGAVAFVGPSCDVADTSPIRRLLVCLDGTSAGEAVLPWATRWSAATGVPLVLVRVVYPLVEPAARVPPTEAQSTSSRT
jgi:nucleotide-binding universal stress UspA family protein